MKNAVNKNKKYNKKKKGTPFMGVLQSLMETFKFLYFYQQ